MHFSNNCMHAAYILTSMTPDLGNFSLPFLPTTSSSSSRTPQGLFELTWPPSRALNSSHAFVENVLLSVVLYMGRARAPHGPSFDPPRPPNTIIYNVLQNVENPFSGEEGIIDERCITIDCAKRSCCCRSARDPIKNRFLNRSVCQ